MMSHLNRIFILIVFCVGCIESNAQPTFNFQELQKLYPEKDAIILNQTEHLEIKNIQKGLKIETSRSSDILYLTEKASHLLNKSIFFYDNFSLVHDINANSWIPDGDGKKLKKISVENIYTRKPVNDNVFYDDIKEKYFLYPSLKKGAVSSLTYSEDIFDPHFLSPFYFGTYAPCENAEFRITFPDNVKIRYVIKDPSSHINFSEEKLRNGTTYIFKSGRHAGFAMEEDAPNSSYFLPHVIVYIESYTVNGVETKNLADVSGLYTWYRELIGRMKNEDRIELKELSDSLTKNISDPVEKIKVVYYWVQDKIKYIAFEEGLGGFIPREPIDTYNKRFGDCKDKSMIMNALLGYAGIDAYPVWIGTRDIPYSYKDVPTPQSDNHMISAVKINNEWVFLDGTSVHLEYGIPTSMIQGKEALIGLNKETFEIQKIPEVSRSKNIVRDKITFAIENDKIQGSGVTATSGYFKQILFYNISQFSSDKRSQYINKSLALGNNKYEASDIIFAKNYENRDSLLEYSYRFSVEDYITKFDDNIYVNLNIKKPGSYTKIDIEKRFSEKVIEFRNSEILETTFEIPAGYEVVSIPKKKEFNEKGFGIKVTYENIGKEIKMIREIYLDSLSIKKEEFTQWNKFVTIVNESGKELIILKKRIQ